MAMNVINRRQRSAAYAANTKTVIELQRGYLYRELHLRLAGQLTVSGANNTAAKTLRGSEWAVISRLELIANGNDTIFTMSGAALRRHNFFYYGVQPRNSVQVGDGSTTNPVFDSVCIIPFTTPRVAKPIDTAIDSSSLSIFTLEVTWGSHLSINADATAFTVAPSLAIESIESWGHSPNSRFSLRRQTEIVINNTATNPRLQFNLPVNDMYFGFALCTTRGGAEVSNIINNVQLKSGQNIMLDKTSFVLRESSNLRLSQGRTYSGSAYDALFNGTANNDDGWYWYQHNPDGLLTEAIDTLGFAEFIIEFDTTYTSGTEQILLYPFQIVAARG
jgi:hypothetical protein